MLNILNSINGVLWGSIMIILLLGCAFCFTWGTRFVQFRMVGEMIRILSESNGKNKKGEKHISSFQAFTVSLASRVGVGNLAGVATAITLGGAGAVFWMWIIALMGSSTAFIESTLAQLYKTKGKDSFIGGPAYYMWKGLQRKWMGKLFAVLIILTFGLAFCSVQSNTICAAFENSFSWNHVTLGYILTGITLIIIFGGIQRIAKVSSIVVPFMAIGYIVLAFYCIVINIGELPSVLKMIFASAFGWEQAWGGGIGAAVMQGIKRGLFSNEAGEGSTPNAAATAFTSHPVKQGLIQALGVFTDTIVICSCTAFIILISRVPIGNADGVKLTQEALDNVVGSVGSVYVALAIFFFAFTSILGNYYYGESNLHFLTQKRWPLLIYRIAVGGIVLFGALTTLDMAWALADVFMAAMTTCNLIAIFLLRKQAFRLLDDYRKQKKAGISSPVFKRATMPDIPGEVECWE